ncbi:succinate dehydrogenase, cytochrome b556 subunit [Rhodocyclus tenuis]|uniref:Succinate dehydrogenase cytochrome b556 subunit n=1 Tax=Rhodocyclus tenuis TaxID=1066 RepID=A0A840FY05_RHOTE|nr:succinate dehydrogenase, cytochrome b556 subunit [Rhodocyclus tenuis]MBB4247007.1 succinate dehydrogenase / fumarate reductase cytochrome b subunit [Rhodocyclus tenuis]MBK1679527.1 succinate dehydrogenase, cytochrome b556 subunit [Rhodocyclus tenuis]
MADTAIRTKKRPKNLDIMSIRLPLPGVLSIIHRLTGAALFILLPVFLWLFERSLATPETFAEVKALGNHLIVRLILLGFIWFYIQHFLTGLRYLLIDLHKGVELEAARFSTKVVFAASTTLMLVIGAFIL